MAGNTLTHCLGDDLRGFLVLLVVILFAFNMELLWLGIYWEA